MAHILSVDDSHDDQELMKEFLTSLNHTFIVASSGEEALKIISNQHFDLIITDYHMSEGDGVCLIERLKKISHSPRCLLVTGEFGLSADYFLTIGASGFSYKPIIWSKLEAEIKRLI